MKIITIEIENFRSYYGVCRFDFNSGLTLIIGDNGDGKTTFYEALDWLLVTTLKEQADGRYISAKYLSEMSIGDSASVRVTMRFEHDDSIKEVEKSFTFIKDTNETAQISDKIKFIGYEEINSDRILTDGKELVQKYFDEIIRKYCFFKGEDELDVLTDESVVKTLLERFSNIKDFDRYIEFVDYAVEESEKVAKREIKKDDKNNTEAEGIQQKTTDYQQDLNKLQNRLDTQKNEADTYKKLIEGIEKNAETAKHLYACDEKIKELENKVKNIEQAIDDRYSIRLLDDKWILCGLSDVLKIFSEKVHLADKRKRELEYEDKKQKGKLEAYGEVFPIILKNGKIPLAKNIPDAKTMEEMIRDECCKVCNREAPKGSEAYKFMISKLNELLFSLDPTTTDTSIEQSIFPHDFIAGLFRQSINFETKKLIRLSDIKNAVSSNVGKKSEIDGIQRVISEKKDEKVRLLAYAPNVSEVDLRNQYHEIMNWVESKSKAEKEILYLQNSITKITEKIDDLKQQLDRIPFNPVTGKYIKIHDLMVKIQKAFLLAKQRNLNELLNLVETRSNHYLLQLNKEDFHGIIKIEHDNNNDSKTVKTILIDNRNMPILDPNTALKTTMNISVLFAVSEITSSKRRNNYPLIFDAPTSSFSDAKQIEFFKQIEGIDKQCIICTKSFLEADPNIQGRNRLDELQINEVKGTVYRIEKNRPFDEKDLSTIQTIVKKIK